MSIYIHDVSTHAISHPCKRAPRYELMFIACASKPYSSSVRAAYKS